MIDRMRARLTYANVTATIALFVALGGSSYAALQVPRDSVGAKQLRRGSVGASELRSSAVTSRHIHNGSVTQRDLSTGAQQALKGQPGPTGPQGAPGPQGASAITYRAVIDAGGGVVRGNAIGANHQASNNQFQVFFPANVAACVYAATLGPVPGDSSDPSAGRITAHPDGGGDVLVRTWAADGTPTPLPFNLIVAC